MTFMRSRAYGRVVRVLESPSALGRLSFEDRETMREVADTLVLARFNDRESHAALAAARSVLLSIRRDPPEPWAEQLADDLEDAGPAPIRLFARPADAPDAPAARHAQGPAWP
ncbi:MAG: hypothetical protein JO243_02495 [Solirubrobacterales bacterium]|nr:hypothetical protein [Solirubrobacterales bacterium]